MTTKAKLPSARPLLRWNGGKSYRLLDIQRILTGFPMAEHHYIEPMVGGGAIYWAFAHRFKRAAIGDTHPELVNFYRVVKDEPEALITELHGDDYWYHTHKGTASKLNYHRIRAWVPTDPVQRAARWYYLNHTCINGLMRTNKQGQMNAAPGDVRPFRVEDELLRACSARLQSTAIFRGDASVILREVLASYGHRKLFLVVDPPYHSDDPGRYTGYAGGFTEAEQAGLVDTMLRSGQPFLYFNLATNFIKQLFPTWVTCEELPLKHKVGPRAARGKEDMELVAYHL